jgi:ribose 5-phosphate isomerase A
LPVEIVSFGYIQTLKRLKGAGFDPSLRMKEGEISLSDGNNIIADLNLGKIDNPIELEKKLKDFVGVIETGLFTNTPDLVIVGEANKIKVLENKDK